MLSGREREAFALKVIDEVRRWHGVGREDRERGGGGRQDNARLILGELSQGAQSVRKGDVLGSRIFEERGHVYHHHVDLRIEGGESLPAEREFVNSIDTAKGTAGWFTGDVYIDSVAAAPPPSRVTAAPRRSRRSAPLDR